MHYLKMADLNSMVFAEDGFISIVPVVEEWSLSLSKAAPYVASATGVTVRADGGDLDEVSVL